MSRTTRPLAAFATLVLIGGCGPAEKETAPVSEHPNTPPSAAPARYDAKAFFTTTTYGLAGGYAWSLEEPGAARQLG